MIAIRVHADQRDKQGEPYLLHVLRVVEAVGDEARVVAALHDVIEDSGLGLVKVGDVAGLDSAEFAALAAISRYEGERYTAYIDRILADEVGLRIAREVKLADLRDNLGRIPAREAAYEMVLTRTLAGPADPITLDLREEWDAEWASLKARYEKAIAVLEDGS